MRYLFGMQHQISTVEPWIEKHAELVPARARLLDVACGYGRHAKFFASRGIQVTAVDRDETAIASLQNVENIRAELRDIEAEHTAATAWPYAPNSFDAVVVCNYLWRPTFSAMLASITSGGVLLYETFLVGNERYGKPSRAEFLLRRGELREVVAPWFDVVDHFEGPIVNQSGEVVAMKSMIAAIKRVG